LSCTTGIHEIGFGWNAAEDAAIRVGEENDRIIKISTLQPLSEAID
jgi:hypothetical protein